VTNGSYLKTFLDTKDVATHGLLSVYSPIAALAVVHTALLAWHTSKAVDSVIISGYSPMHGLLWPNFFDTAVYVSSTVVGALESPLWVLGGVTLYACARAVDCVY